MSCNAYNTHKALAMIYRQSARKCWGLFRNPSAASSVIAVVVVVVIPELLSAFLALYYKCHFFSYPARRRTK